MLIQHIQEEDLANTLEVGYVLHSHACLGEPVPGLDLNQLLEARHSLVNIGENPCDVHEAGCTHQGVVAGERQLEDLCGRLLLEDLLANSEAYVGVSKKMAQCSPCHT